jgi:hypothetical protein
MPGLEGVPLPSVKYIEASVKPQDGFHGLHTLYPGMLSICPSIAKNADTTKQPWLDHVWRVSSVQTPENGRSCPLTIRIERNIAEPGVDVHDVSGFRKVTHILDPESWLKNKYRIPLSIPDADSLEESYGPLAWTKMQDEMNHAYVEALASFAVGKLREKDISPHFHMFYGAFTCIADTYTYNITDTFMIYRASRWFWDSQEDGRFTIGFEKDVPAEVRTSVCQKPDEVFDDSSDEESSVELDVAKAVADENASLKSAEDDDFEEASDDEESSSGESEDTEDPLVIFADIKNFPVMTIFTETSESTMDDLLDDYEAVGARPGEDKWIAIWSAWIFQVMAALCAAQAVFGFTHNDLHSNNIVWSNTNEEFLYYKTRAGTVYKVPTYGKLFRIIDFGRAIFKINNKTFFSDDFRKNNEADEMYNFGELYNEEEPLIEPNPSFDLARFTVSVFEAIFPESPELKKKAKILSAEPGLTIKETVSPLYNLLWSWLICDDGHNILMNPDGSERYPDFDLYKVIAAEVHGAIPSMHIDDEAFSAFVLNQTKETKGVKVYSLFC